MVKTTCSATETDVVGCGWLLLAGCAGSRWLAREGFLTGQKFLSDLVAVSPSNSEDKVGKGCACLKDILLVRLIEIVVVWTWVIPGKNVFCFRKKERPRFWRNPLMRRSGSECDARRIMREL